MLRTKIFETTDANQTQDIINRWLAENPGIEVLSTNTFDVWAYIILYEDYKTTQEGETHEQNELVGSL